MVRALTRMIAAVVAMATLTPVVAVAQEKGDKPAKPALPSYVLRDTIDDSTLQTRDGQPIGDIDDLIVDNKTKHVVFAVVSTADILGAGDQLRAIPYELLQWRQEASRTDLFADVSKKNLEMAPKYEHGKLHEHLASEQWHQQTRTAFGTQTPTAGATGDRHPDGKPVLVVERPTPEAPARWLRASKMIDTKIVVAAKIGKGEGPAAAKEGFGDVDDLVIHRTSRKVVAVLVSRNGASGADQDRFIIPCSALEETENATELRVNRSMDEMMKAPPVQKDVTARLADNQFRAGIAKFYGVNLDG